MVLYQHAARDVYRLDARLERDPEDNVEGPRRDAREMKAIRPSQDRHVDVRRDLGCQRHAQRLTTSNTISLQAAAVASNPLILSVAPMLPGMVINIDDEPALESRDAGSGQIAALHDDRGVEVTGNLCRNLNTRHAGKHHERRQHRIPVDDADLLTQARRAYAVASWGPGSAFPSGRACDESTNVRHRGSRRRFVRFQEPLSSGYGISTGVAWSAVVGCSRVTRK